ncbi:MAG: LuxR family transcriptional regulator [Parvularculaceae bacterium]|nr:LuxR family transcriptional regulator [Parvularculaceae bacterium]
MPITLDDFVARSLEIRDPNALKAYFQEAMKAAGFDCVLYRHIAELFRKVPLDKSCRIDTFPKAWTERYAAQRYFDDDPLINETRRRGTPFRWFDLEERGDLTPRQKAFFVDLRAAGFVDGVAAPVFSRPGDIAYFGLSATAAPIEATDGALLELQAICQQMHVRYAMLTSPADAPTLSPRETEVLQLIAQGLSNADIAERLAVSTHTIDTLVRRCFEKLGVSTRVEAALSAIGRGLILP